MASANRVLAEIGAMKSLIENFPMSILDDMGSQGETYDSVFKFMIDLLYSCGIDTNRIFSEILTQLYSFLSDYKDREIQNHPFYDTGLSFYESLIPLPARILHKAI